MFWNRQCTGAVDVQAGREHIDPGQGGACWASNCTGPGLDWHRRAVSAVRIFPETRAAFSPTVLIDLLFNRSRASRQALNKPLKQHARKCVCMHARALFARYCDPAQAALEPIFKIDFPNGVSPERLARAFILKQQQTLATPTTPRPKARRIFPPTCRKLHAPSTG